MGKTDEVSDLDIGTRLMLIYTLFCYREPWETFHDDNFVRVMSLKQGHMVCYTEIGNSKCK